MKRIIAALALSAATLLSSSAFAAEQVVYLRDGSVLHGAASTANGVVSVETAHGTLKIPERDVLRIENAESAGSPMATPPPPPPTPAPGETSAQPQPTPQSREGWYRAGEAPAPAPVMTPPPSGPSWQPGPTTVYKRRDPFAEDAFGIEGKLNLHIYGGRGWSRFDDQDNAGLGAGGLEMVIRSGIQHDRNVRLDAIGEIGFYAGSRDCQSSLNPGACTPVSASTFYGDGGLRITLYGPPFYVYGQGAIGGAASNFAYGNIGSDTADNNSTGGGFEANVAGGAGLSFDQFQLFGEVKYLHAPTSFDGSTIEMGGVTLSLGLGLVF